MHEMGKWLYVNATDVASLCVQSWGSKMVREYCEQTWAM